MIKFMLCLFALSVTHLWCIGLYILFGSKAVWVGNMGLNSLGSDASGQMTSLHTEDLPLKPFFYSQEYTDWATWGLVEKTYITKLKTCKSGLNEHPLWGTFLHTVCTECSSAAWTCHGVMVRYFGMQAMWGLGTLYPPPPWKWSPIQWTWKPDTAPALSFFPLPSVLHALSGC